MCSKRLQVGLWRTRRRFLGTWYADIGDRMEAVRSKRWFVTQRAPGTEPRCAEKVRYSWSGGRPDRSTDKGSERSAIHPTGHFATFVRRLRAARYADET